MAILLSDSFCLLSICKLLPNLTFANLLSELKDIIAIVIIYTPDLAASESRLRLELATNFNALING